MKTLFSLDPATLAALQPAEAVEAFRLLLCAEAARLGVSPAKINVPAAINVSDGGIDATVESHLEPEKEGLVFSGVNRYQIKTGTSLEPWQPAAIKSELFGKNDPTKKQSLGAAVSRCLEADGRYVLVCFGMDIVAKDLDKANELLTSSFKGCGFANPKVAVLGKSQLVSAFEQFPALTRRLNRLPDTAPRDQRSWSSDAEMNRPFQANSAQAALIKAVQDALRSQDTSHIRVCGEAGAGKTRLMLEATRDADLASRVLYCDTPQLLAGGVLQALTQDETLYAILIVDECDPDERARLANRLTTHAARIRVATIYQEADNASGLNLLVAPPLEEQAIIEIIGSYGTPLEVARRWAALCDGSPRVAHVIGENLRANPDDVLMPPSTNNIWDRYVQGVRSGDDPRAAQTRIVLRYLSLFQRFGFAPPVESEAKAISAMIMAADSQITWPRFCEIVKELRSRRILQGERTLYITPKALQIWLWSEWWDTYGNGFDLAAFLANLPGTLPEWFKEMWRYAHRSQAAKRVVDKLLGPGGPFSDGTLLKAEFGADFLLALTDASPESVIDCLERTVGAWSHEGLLAFTTGRRKVVFALERIVVWRALCTRGARILLALAAAENETWSNNSTGVFASLFSHGCGKVAPSEASPEERFPVLVEAVTSSKPEQRAVGLKAAHAALETEHFSRMVGAEYQGLRSPPQLWMPKSYGELFDSYRRVWSLLKERLPAVEESERDAIVTVMLQQSRGLLRTANLAPICLDTLSQLRTQGWAAPKRILDVCEDVLHYDAEHMPPETVAQVKNLRDDLVGSGLPGRLQRYIALSRLEDNYADGARTGNWETIADGLADEAIAQPDCLREALVWLVTFEAESAAPFGYRIGKRDSGKVWLKEIEKATIAAGDRRSLMFLGGYLKAIFKDEPEVCERLMDRWTENPEQSRLVPELTWRIGVSDRSATRLVGLLRTGTIDASQLASLRFGRATDDLSANAAGSLIEALLDTQTPQGASLAVELTESYRAHGKEGAAFPHALTERTLTNPVLFSSRFGNQSITGYEWLQLAMPLVKADSELGVRLLPYLIAQAEERGSIFDQIEGDVAELAVTILKDRPDEAWAIIESRLNNRSTMMATLNWLGGGNMLEESPGLWHVVPLDRLWQWIDHDLDERAWAVATVVPRTLEADDLGAVTRAFVRRYGNRDDVKRNLLAHFHSGSWWGNASDYFAGLKRTAERWQQAETDPVVREWLELYVKTLTDDIERSRIEEERERF